MSRQYGKDITSPDAYIVTKKIIHPTEPKIMQDYFAKAIEYSGITKAVTTPASGNVIGLC